MTEISAGRSRLVVLDGLRGFAAVAVVVLHGTETFGLPWVPNNAYLAVDFFFLLSGYVLAKSFDDRLRRGYFASFLKLRLIRLYPLIIVGSSIGVLVLICRYIVQNSLSAPEVIIDYICSMLLLPTPPLLTPHWQIYPCDQPLWSLFYELLINIVYALIAPYLTNRILNALTFVSAIALAVTIVLRGNADFSLDYFFLGITRVSFSFFAGVLVFREMESATGGRIRRALQLPSYASAIIVVALMATLFWPDTPGAMLAMLAIFGLFPAMLIGSVCTSEPGHRISPLYARLGLLSYPVYAVHHPFFRLISGMSFHSGGLAMRFGLLMLSLLLVSVLAWALTIYYDAPARRWLTKRLPTVERGPAAADITIAPARS